jgi:site-specific recombinase XerD
MIDLVSIWHGHLRRRGLASESITKFVRCLRMVEDHYGVEAHLLGTDELTAYLDTRQLGPRARYSWISTLHVFYEWAVIHYPHRVPVDPTLPMERPRLKTGLPRPIPDADLEGAVAAADWPVRPWLVLGGWAGLRCMEIAGLRTEHVLTDQRVLLIVGKGGRERLVPIHPRVEEVLPRGGKPGPLWRREDGCPFTAGQVSRRLGDHFRELGMGWTAHQLRHRFGTRVHQASGDLLVTQNLLGHASPTTTAIYAAFSTERAAEAVNRVA